MAAPQEWPEGAFDLVVVSEVGYFLSPAGLDGLVGRVAASLVAGRRGGPVPLAAPGARVAARRTGGAPRLRARRCPSRGRDLPRPRRGDRRPRASRTSGRTRCGERAATRSTWSCPRATRSCSSVVVSRRCDRRGRRCSPSDPTCEVRITVVLDGCVDGTAAVVRARPGHRRAGGRRSSRRAGPARPGCRRAAGCGARGWFGPVPGWRAPTPTASCRSGGWPARCVVPSRVSYAAWAPCCPSSDRAARPLPLLAGAPRAPRRPPPRLRRQPRLHACGLRAGRRLRRVGRRRGRRPRAADAGGRAGRPWRPARNRSGPRPAAPAGCAAASRTTSPPSPQTSPAPADEVDARGPCGRGRSG